MGIISIEIYFYKGTIKLNGQTKIQIKISCLKIKKLILVNSLKKGDIFNLSQRVDFLFKGLRVLKRKSDNLKYS
jgi:hypothetical protein